MTINTERYVQVVGKFWTALGRRRGVVRVLQWFQQDGAIPHTSNESLAWQQQRFPDRLISRRCDPQWSAHSLDLNPPCFFICGDTLIHQAPVFWKLAQVQAAGPRYIRGRRTIYSYFTECNGLCRQCSGGVLPQKMLFLESTWLDNRKCDLTENQWLEFCRKYASATNIFCSVGHGIEGQNWETLRT